MMKRFKQLITVLAALAMLTTLVGCGSTSNGETTPTVSTETPAESTSPVPETETDTETDTQTDTQGNTLIVYFSRVGNTNFDSDVDAVSSASLNLDADGNLVGNMQIMADMIAEVTDAKVFEIQTVSPYPEVYRDTTDLANDEKASGARPELATHVENMEQYDTIFLGYPNWWGTIPMPVCTFLEEYDFSNKTVIPFASHEGSGLGSGPRDITALIPDATILDGFAVRGGSVNNAREDIITWVNGLGIDWPVIDTAAVN